MSPARPLIHFWCPEDVATGVAGWDPDADPHRYASGVGRNLLELAVRLSGEGVAVAIGERTRGRPDVVVVAAGNVRTHERPNVVRALRAIARAGGRFVLIRGDALPRWRFAMTPTVEVMPRAGAVRLPHQRWVPPLPQRALVPRRSAPLDRIRAVGIKCNPENLPGELRDPAFARALADAGAELSLDVPSTSFGADQRWHDFERLDAVLCVRSGAIAAEWVDAKPATRLVNAWAAGCLPIAAREPANVELATDAVDACFVESVAEIPALVAALNRQPERLRALEQGVRRRQAEFEPRRVLQLWRELLQEAAATPRPHGGAGRALAAAGLVYGIERGGRARRALRRRRAPRTRRARGQPSTRR